MPRRNECSPQSPPQVRVFVRETLFSHWIQIGLETLCIPMPPENNNIILRAMAFLRPPTLPMAILSCPKMDCLVALCRHH